jgi:hypothetical protein
VPEEQRRRMLQRASEKSKIRASGSTWRVARSSRAYGKVARRRLGHTFAGRGAPASATEVTRLS